MDTDEETALRRRVQKALGLSRIEDPVWEDVVETEHVGEALRNPDEDDPAFDSLRARVERLRERFQEMSPRVPRKDGIHLTIDDAFPPYVTKLTEALGEKDVGPYADGFRDPMSFWIEDGRLVIEAEPWVPAKSVERAFLELQFLVFDGERNRSISVKALDRYCWVRSRRETQPDESWRKQMAAWNRAHAELRSYDNVRNFRRDFVRTEAFLDRVKHICQTVDEWHRFPLEITSSPPE